MEGVALGSDFLSLVGRRESLREMRTVQNRARCSLVVAVENRAHEADERERCHRRPPLYQAAFLFLKTFLPRGWF